MRHRVLVVVLVGCGGGGSTAVDARVDDAPAIDAPIDAPMGPYRYVIDKIALPTTNNEARAMGFDLDNNGLVDNQLGLVAVSFATTGLGIQEDADRSVDRGDAINLIDFETTGLAAATGSSLTWAIGTNPMPQPCAGSSDMVCRHHLAGTASFGTVGTPDAPLVGDIVGNTYLGGGGHVTIALALFGSPVMPLTLLGAQVKLSNPAASTLGSITIGGAISQTEITTKLVPQMRNSMMAAIANDCTMLTSPPSCGCADNSPGKSVQSVFDVNPKDCSIDLDELQNNSLFVSLLWPDVTVENQQATSIGFTATAVHASF